MVFPIPPGSKRTSHSWSSRRNLFSFRSGFLRTLCTACVRTSASSISTSLAGRSTCSTPRDSRKRWAPLIFPEHFEACTFRAGRPLQLVLSSLFYNEPRIDNPLKLYSAVQSKYNLLKNAGHLVAASPIIRIRHCLGRAMTTSFHRAFYTRHRNCFRWLISVVVTSQIESPRGSLRNNLSPISSW